MVMVPVRAIVASVATVLVRIRANLVASVPRPRNLPASRRRTGGTDAPAAAGHRVKRLLPIAGTVVLAALVLTAGAAWFPADEVPGPVEGCGPAAPVPELDDLRVARREMDGCLLVVGLNGSDA